MFLRRAPWCFMISIHAPREGGDSQQQDRLCGNSNFNPRPPRGGRRGQRPAKRTQHEISIHAPREGGDVYFIAILLVVR